MIAAAMILTTRPSPAVEAAAATHPTVLRAWRFNRAGDLQGWVPGGDVKNIEARADGLHFETVGDDPLIVGPPFEPIAATNNQVVVVEVACDQPVAGELYYTNKTEGRYGGFEPDWMTSVFIPSGGAPGRVQSIVIWPFWEKLGTISRLRFDPPTGATCRLVSIRIEDGSGQVSPDTDWDFTKGDLGTWRPMYGLATPAPQAGKPLEVAAPTSQGLLLTAVKPFDAASRPLLHVAADVEQDLAFYWVTREGKGMLGMSIGRFSKASPNSGRATLGDVVDLRSQPAWKGTVTHIGIGPTDGALPLRSVRLLAAGSDSPAVARWFGLVRPINRAGQDVLVRLTLENVSAQPIEPYDVRLQFTTDPQSRAAFDGGPACEPHASPLPRILPGQKASVEWTVRPPVAGAYVVRALRTDGITPWFATSVRIDPPVKVEKADYVPPPRPVRTDHDIGVYYFPGWAPDRPDGTSGRWARQADFPERTPVLGWYREGSPEVADWHIKWAVENGIRFFIYDWYWRDGKIALQEGLHDGLLKARYREMLKFCIMWANHVPFAGHTREQFVQVADYWIEHYLRLPNYYRIDGRPYISFFHVGELRACFGTDEKLRDALAAMRTRIVDAGLGNPYIVICGDAGKHSQEWYKTVGFDAVTAYNYPAAGACTAQSPYPVFVGAHEDIWRAAHKVGVVPYLPLLTSNWDARPWHGAATNARFGRTTARFESGLKRLRAFLDETGGRVGIIEAWNEWGEGSYIEPNLEFGFGDLEAIRRTFARPGDWPANIAPDDVGLGPYDVRTTAAGPPLRTN